jgi:hypothetical protein
MWPLTSAVHTARRLSGALAGFGRWVTRKSGRAACTAQALTTAAERVSEHDGGVALVSPACRREASEKRRGNELLAHLEVGRGDGDTSCRGLYRPVLLQLIWAGLWRGAPHVCCSGTPCDGRRSPVRRHRTARLPHRGRITASRPSPAVATTRLVVSLCWEGTTASPRSRTPGGCSWSGRRLRRRCRRRRRRRR